MRLDLDMPTLMLNVGLTGLYATVAMGYVWLVHRRETAVRWWAGSFLAIAAGVLLVAQRGSLPELWTVIIGNLLVIAGACLMYIGTARFGRWPVAWRTLLVLGGLCVATLIYWTYIDTNYKMRVVVFSFATGLAWLMLVRDLWRSGQHDMRITYRFVAVVYAICVVASFGRMIHTLFDADATQIFSGGLTETLWLSAGMAILFFSPFGFLLMTSQRLQLRLDRLANEDELTGVLNRRAFLTRAMERIAQDRADTPASMLALDIDHFKRLNDSRGHAAGDAVLRGFARTIAAQLRPQDLFARVGGEEFWVLLPQTGLDTATQVAERLRAAVADTRVQHGGALLQVTVSIGVSRIDDGDIAAALSAADRAMYRAKEQGRNRVVCA
jgi:diguanylate cyclase (GGDEF)-like protein